MKKILIIEDDQLVANIYRNKFTVDDYQVEVALDGEAGLEMVASFQPDAIILDLMLPKVSGLELLKKIRADAKSKTIPVIVFSNTYLSNMVQEAWKAGATKCLSKANCTPKQVIEVVRAILSPAAPKRAEAMPNPPSRYQAPPAPEVDAEAEAAFQAGLRKTFLEGLPAAIIELRTTLQALAKSVDETGRIQQLQVLYRQVHAQTASAGMAGMAQTAQMADALEAFLRELVDKPKSINASTLRTVATSVDFLGLQGRSVQSQSPQTPLKASIMVVDDEIISRRAVTFALEKAKLSATSVDSPAEALKLLEQSSYDLVILDVEMPGMNGFELCTRIRSLPLNQKTPVIFVTTLNDFESRANSTMSGGNDIIAKPFLFMELAVKALVHTLRGRMAVPGR